MAGVYKHSGFYIIDNRNSYETVEKEKSWYVLLNNTPIYFSSLKEARIWCKKNYLDGVFHGWIKA